MSIFDFLLASTNWKMEYEIDFRVSTKNEKWKMDVHIPFSIFHSQWKMKITVCTQTYLSQSHTVSSTVRCYGNTVTAVSEWQTRLFVTVCDLWLKE